MDGCIDEILLESHLVKDSRDGLGIRNLKRMYNARELHMTFAF
jgi:hypothetical protein